MPVGEQAEVATPGNNVKRHVAGSLVRQSGTLLISSPAKRRNAELFIAGFAYIYDQNGDGAIDSSETPLRTAANEVFAAINDGDTSDESICTIELSLVAS
jgi:hypothetical protein